MTLYTPHLFKTRRIFKDSPGNIKPTAGSLRDGLGGESLQLWDMLLIPWSVEPKQVSAEAFTAG
jgi:hypothetical protein